MLAIKQTVYRTSDDSTLVPALIRAAERGKQAVCLVELQARFDERTNIHWAKALEQAGVHVVYGHPALKTHAKCVLVVRREGDGVRNYVHIGTGNYHSATARLYTDFGLFTTDEAIGADVAELFNYLTGFGRPLHYRKVLVAPSYLRDGILERDRAHDRRALAQLAGADRDQDQRARRRRCIRALYRASQAGVRVDLNVRGICCLRPGVPGMSENIRVVSIVGRLPRALAHLRLRARRRAQDLHLLRRPDAAQPRPPRRARPCRSRTPSCGRGAGHARACLADNHNAWELDGHGNWHRRSAGPDEQPRSLQLELAELYAARARAERPPGEPEVIRGLPAPSADPAATGQSSATGPSPAADTPASGALTPSSR